MAHGQEGLGLAAQQVFEPEDAVQVEVVRGLVQEQQFRLAAQLAGDRKTLPPASREQARGLVAVLEAGLAHGQARPGLGLVLVHPGAEGGLVQDRGHGGVGGEVGILRHVADAQPLARRTHPRRRRLEPGQDLQERGLARPVRTHEADVVAVEDAEGEAFEERGRAEGLGELLAGKQEIAHACTPGASCPVRSTYST